MIKMIGWMKDTISEQLDLRAERRHRSALRAEGIPLEAALTLAKDARPRQTVFRQSLGEKGHRDWTHLRAHSHWSSEEDREKLDDVFKSLVTTTTKPAVEFDIADVDNILLSKSTLSRYPTMEVFEKRSPNHEYGQGTPGDLQRCLAHEQIRCLKGTLHKSESFTSFGWDDRLLLNNMGGSHHFSAARRIAREQGIKVPLQLKHEHHALNPDAVHFVEQSLVLLVIPHEDLFKELRYALRQEMVPVIPGRFRAPRCYGNDAHVLALSLKSEPSAKAANYLRSCGFTDLVDHLIEDLGVQHARMKRLN